jgi:Na+/H+-dicarboxylate symporter
MSSTTRNILIGLALGVATGLFFGEKAGVLQFVAEGYVRLLQMTVLPYVMVSLIEGIGSLSGAGARRLFVRVGTLSLLLWVMALGAVMLMPLAFPEVESASFFSTTLVENRPPLDFVALYIPSNPFHSLANNVVPAVVLFSIFLGVALIAIERKERLLENLLLIERGLKRANQFAVALTPIGLFAIAAQMAPLNSLVGTSSTSTRLFFQPNGGRITHYVYPAFTVAVPHPVTIRFPLAYPVARRDLEFARFLGIWIELQRKNGTIQAL